MRLGTSSVSLLLAGFLLGCGQAAEDADSGAAPALPITGLYKVTGKTVTLATGTTREIAGTVTLNQTGDAYTATFSLNTTAPGSHQAMPAEVIGTGEGSIAGRTLTGTADTQIVMSTVPGIDPGFAFIPRMVSTRIRSTSNAVVANDGAVTIEIENEGVAGQEYAKTRTSLRGRRIADAAVGGPQPVRAPEGEFDDLHDYDPQDYVDEELPADEKD